MRSSVDRQEHPKKQSADGTIHNTPGYLRAAIKYAHKIGKLETIIRQKNPHLRRNRHSTRNVEIA
ncbi:MULTISPECIES: hypothetical protein [Burkholderia]|uniref:hypothetical protein n=1 Tax=Burkholderia TaxID=32008 RepID=UPI001F481971|nr:MULTISPECIES: hypothetical protein [Burkholderia]